MSCLASVDWNLWSQIGSAVGGLGGIAGLIALFMSWRMNAHVKASNRIAQDNLQHLKEQAEVRFLIVLRTEREQTQFPDGRIDEKQWLEVDVINDGVEAEIEYVGLRKRGWAGWIAPRGCSSNIREPIRLKPKAKQVFTYSDLTVTAVNFPISGGHERSIGFGLRSGGQRNGQGTGQTEVHA